jgi:Domain of unknown function (DUF4384)
VIVVEGYKEVEKVVVVTTCAIILALGNGIGVASEIMQGEGTRKLLDTVFRQKRPPAKKTPGSQRPPSDRPGEPSAPKTVETPESMVDSLIGITIWRLRPSIGSDDTTSRMLVHPKGTGKALEFTPVRVEAETRLSEKDRIRFSIEVPRGGYLYVIDREEYNDGSLGQAQLIFPTLRIRNGDNELRAGRVIEIPAQDDDPSSFELTRSGTSHIGEVLTLLVNSQRLRNVQIGEGAAPLPKQQLDDWEKKWGAHTERFESVGGAGGLWTRAEREAGADASRLLSQEDPLPQTIFRVHVKTGNPLLVTLRLRIEN